MIFVEKCRKSLFVTRGLARIVVLRPKWKKHTTYISILKIEFYLDWILFSLREEIIEHSYSLWFPRERTAIVVLHMLRLTEAIFE